MLYAKRHLHDSDAVTIVTVAVTCTDAVLRHDSEAFGCFFQGGGVKDGRPDDSQPTALLV
jgi:hypothetical protein